VTPFDAFRRWRRASLDAARRRWAEPIRTPLRRIAAWASLIVNDHGIVRPRYWNAHWVTPDLMRGPQPNPLHLVALKRQGVRTIVNLRGPTEYGSYALERDAVARLGLAYEEAVIWSRSAPTREQVRALDALYARIETPALVHCKSGADRAGMASALWLILRDGRSVAEARRQLSLRYGHVRSAKTGVLDAFFDAYEADTRETSMDFRVWVETVYDRDAVERSFHEGWWGSFLVDKLLRRE
jgi:protein tyrosine/serine phosphatase